MNKVTLVRDIKSLNIQVTKYSPAILVFLGITGMVSTVIMACKATPKAKDILDDLHAEQEEYDEIYSKPVQVLKDTKAVAPVYIPSIIMGGMSIACIIGSYSINAKRLAALATAYSLSERTLHEYQKKVVDTFGAKKEERIRDEIAKDRIEKDPPTNMDDLIMEGDGNMLCYDSVLGGYFPSNINKIRRAESDLNRRLITEMYISVNDFYDEIGRAPIRLGNEIGWNVDNLIRFSFSSILTKNDQTCLVIDYDVCPRFDFRKLY